MLRTDIRSLNIQTGIDVLWTGGRTVDRDTHVVVCEPGNPLHHWGNFLVFPHAPTLGSKDEWEALFRREFGPDCRHFAFTWDTVSGEEGELSEFEAAGYEIGREVALTAEAGDLVKPPKWADDVTVRRLDADDADAWADVTELEVETREPGHAERDFRAYASRKIRHYRSLVRGGLGAWLTAWDGDTLVGSLGVFVFDGRARYQAVVTHPDHRRRGIASRLVHEAGQAAVEEFGAQRLVMVADEDYHAAQIYESCGFQPTEHDIGVSWWPRSTE